MGLAEKRERKTAEDGWIPKREAEVVETVGAAIPIKVDWESFEGDLKGLNWFEHNGPHQVNGALRLVCRDELGKKTVAESVKEILFKNVADPTEKKLGLEGGVLIVAGAYAQSPRGRYDIHQIKDFLEGAL